MYWKKKQVRRTSSSFARVDADEGKSCPKSEIIVALSLVAVSPMLEATRPTGKNRHSKNR
ncbi:hypothetical protein Pcac1_g25619 [Phytophthora cactorum]|nr:hypothetical protein Pcac1_g25619 [Phytophthora cactorum]